MKMPGRAFTSISRLESRGGRAHFRQSEQMYKRYFEKTLYALLFILVVFFFPPCLGVKKKYITEKYQSVGPLHTSYLFLQQQQKKNPLFTQSVSHAAPLLALNVY